LQGSADGYLAGLLVNGAHLQPVFSSRASVTLGWLFWA